MEAEKLQSEGSRREKPACRHLHRRAGTTLAGMLSAVGFMLVLLGAASAAAAPGQPPEDPATSSQARMHVHNYGDFDKTCVRWNDGCRSCSRGQKPSVCSNIGIACQPGPLRCTVRQPSDSGTAHSPEL
jgi:hypothetical protein